MRSGPLPSSCSWSEGSQFMSICLLKGGGAPFRCDLTCDIVDGALGWIVFAEEVPVVKEARAGILFHQCVVAGWRHAGLNEVRLLRWTRVRAVVQIEEGGEVNGQQDGDKQPEGAAGAACASAQAGSMHQQSAHRAYASAAMPKVRHAVRCA